MATQGMTRAERKLMLVRQIRLLGPPQQNVEVRGAVLDKLLDARVELEFAALQMIVAGHQLMLPIEVPPGLSAAEDIAKVEESVSAARFAGFQNAYNQLQAALHVSLGDLPKSGPGVSQPPAS